MTRLNDVIRENLKKQEKSYNSNGLHAPGVATKRAKTEKNILEFWEKALKWVPWLFLWYSLVHQLINAYTFSAINYTGLFFLGACVVKTAGIVTNEIVFGYSHFSLTNHRFKHARHRRIGYASMVVTGALIIWGLTTNPELGSSSFYFSRVVPSFLVLNCFWVIWLRVADPAQREIIIRNDLEQSLRMREFRQKSRLRKLAFDLDMKEKSAKIELAHRDLSRAIRIMLSPMRFISNRRYASSIAREMSSEARGLLLESRDDDGHDEARLVEYEFTCDACGSRATAQRQAGVPGRRRSICDACNSK